MLACLWACNCFLLEPFEDDDLVPECTDCGEEEVEFLLDPTCELEGELTVEIGHGEGRLGLLDDGEPPEIYTGGGFQGEVNEHYYASVRVGNVDPERYDRVEILVTNYGQGQCRDDGEPCSVGSAVRRVVGGDEDPWTLVDGNVEEYGIQMPYYGQVTTQVVVRDPCGREGWAQHRW